MTLAPGGEAEQAPEGVAGQVSSLDDGDVGRVDRLHANDMIAAIDMMHLTGDAGTEIAEQIKSGATDLLDGDIALERRVVLVPFNI